jgi:hypothetical protein
LALSLITIKHALSPAASRLAGLFVSASLAIGVEFIPENGGGPAVRLRKV